jgi:hypothetical protein
MTETTRLHPSYRAALLASCLLIPIATSLLFQVNTNAQQQCTTPPQQNSSGWPLGANVTVVFDENSTFSTEEIGAIRRAYDNWNASKGPTPGNNSAVTFVGFMWGPTPDFDVATNVYFIKRDPMTGSPYPADTILRHNPNSGSDTAVAVTWFREGGELRTVL